MWQHLTCVVQVVTAEFSERLQRAFAEYSLQMLVGRSLQMFAGYL